jgi:hypothetical protein
VHACVSCTQHHHLHHHHHHQQQQSPPLAIFRLQRLWRHLWPSSGCSDCGATSGHLPAIVASCARVSRARLHPSSGCTSPLVSFPPPHSSTLECVFLKVFTHCLCVSMSELVNSRCKDCSPKLHQCTPCSVKDVTVRKKMREEMRALKRKDALAQQPLQLTFFPTMPAPASLQIMGEVQWPLPKDAKASAENVSPTDSYYAAKIQNVRHPYDLMNTFKTH